MMTRVFVYEYISGGLTEASAMPELLAQGRAMRDAMIADLAQIADVIVTCAMLPEELAAGGYDAPNLVACAREPGENPFAFVRRQAVRHDVTWLVAPESDGILLSLHDAVDASRWLGCSGAAISLAASKRATARHLAGCDIAATQPWSDEEPQASGAQYWVVKPDNGAGAERTYHYTGFDAAHDAWLQRMEAGEAVVMEPWVEGEPLSVSLICSPGSTEVLSINRQHVRVDVGGQVHYDGVALNAFDLESVSGKWIARVAESVVTAMPGLAGFVGIDMVWHPRRGPVVIEVNPRLTSAYVGMSALLGRNLAREMLAIHQVANEMTQPDGASHGQ